MATTPQELNIWQQPHFQAGLNIDAGQLVVVNSATVNSGTYNYGGINVGGASSFGYASDTSIFANAPTPQVALELRGANTAPDGAALVFTWEGHNSLYLYNSSLGWLSFETDSSDTGYPVNVAVQGQLTTGANLTVGGSLTVNSGTFIGSSPSGTLNFQVDYNNTLYEAMRVDGGGNLTLSGNLILPYDTALPALGDLGATMVTSAQGTVGEMAIVSDKLYLSGASGTWLPSDMLRAYGPQLTGILHFEDSLTSTRGTQATFTRATPAYTSNGQVWAAGAIRYVPGYYGEAVLSEQQTENLVYDSDFENGASVWTYNSVSGGSGSLTTTQAWIGSYSYEVNASGTGTGQGIYQDIVGLASGTSYTVSTYLDLPSGCIVEFGLESNFTTTVTGIGAGWQRYDVSGVWGADTADTALIIYCTNGSPATAYTFYIDSVQVEPSPYETSYIRNDSLTSSVTRDADLLSYPSVSLIGNTTGGLNDQGSISAWIYLGTNHGRSFLWSCGVDGGPNDIDLLYDQGEILYFRVYGASTNMSLNGYVAPNGWTHVVASWNTTTINLWVNGYLFANATGTLPAIATLASNFYVGASVSSITGSQPNTSIDELYFFNEFLTDTQVYDLYVATQPSLDLFANSNGNVDGHVPSTTPVAYDLVQYDGAGNITANQITIYDNTIYAGDLTIGGSTFATINAQVGGNLVVSGTSQLDGATTLGGTLTVAGIGTFNAGITVPSGQTITLDGTLAGGMVNPASGTVAGNWTVDGNLYSGAGNTSSGIGWLGLADVPKLIAKQSQYVPLVSQIGLAIGSGITSQVAGTILYLDAYASGTNPSWGGWTALLSNGINALQLAPQGSLKSQHNTLDDGSGNVTITGTLSGEAVSLASGTVAGAWMINGALTVVSGTAIDTSLVVGPSTPSTTQVLTANGGIWNNNQYGNIYLGYGQADMSFDGGSDGVFNIKNTSNLAGAATVFHGTSTGSIDVPILTLANTGFVQVSNNLQVGVSGTTGFITTQTEGSNPWFGMYDSGNNRYYGISAGLGAPGGTSTLGGYYSGLGIGGATTGTGEPIFGVLASNQNSNGLGSTALTIYDTNKVETYHNTLDDGSGNAIISGSFTVYGSSTFDTGLTLPSGQTFTNDGTINGGVVNPASGTVAGTWVMDGLATFNAGLNVPSGQSLTLDGSITAVEGTTTAGHFGVATTVAYVSDTLLTVTTATNVLSFTPPVQGCYTVWIYFRIVNATTTVTLAVTYTDGSGAQNHSVIDAIAEVVDSYIIAPIYVNATTAAPIVVQFTASIANNLYYSATITGF